MLGFHVLVLYAESAGQIIQTMMLLQRMPRLQICKVVHRVPMITRPSRRVEMAQHACSARGSYLPFLLRCTLGQ